MKINNLSVRDKISQMIIIGLQDNKINDDLIEMIRDYKVGGVIIYSKNYTSYEEMLSIINKIKEINSTNDIPIFISIDQEGGRVNRFSKGISNLRSAKKIADTQNYEIVKESGHIIGKMLRQTGITLDCAPVLDIKRFEDDHPIGNRCYGENKEDVSRYGIAVMNAIQEENVIAAIKHFPGHGATVKDSHFTLPKIERSIEELEKDDMIPFRDAIGQGADAVMVGHLVVKDIDKYPASLSRKIIGTYIKEKYNFKGLIITDDLKMLAIRLKYGMKFATNKAIESGNDIILIGVSYRTVKNVINYLTKKVLKGIIPIERIEYSVNKIIAMKNKYNVNDTKVSGFDIERINEEIKNINDTVSINENNKTKNDIKEKFINNNVEQCQDM